LFEETGIKDIEIKEEVTFEERYDFEQNGIAYNKINTYYLGFVDKMLEGNQLDEIDELKWVKIDEAQNTLSHQSAIDVIKKLSEFLK
jgi:8-oxo-dGTP pyrophosphatase MutT (NUDIX family)